MQKTSKHWLQK